MLRPSSRSRGRGSFERSRISRAPTATYDRTRDEDGSAPKKKLTHSDDFPTLDYMGKGTTPAKVSEYLRHAFNYTSSDAKGAKGVANVFVSNPPAIIPIPDDPPQPEGAGGASGQAKLSFALHAKICEMNALDRRKQEAYIDIIFHKLKANMGTETWARVEDGFDGFDNMVRDSNLCALVARMHTGLINIGSGNPTMDKFRVDQKMGKLKKRPDESIVEFKTRLAEYEKERTAHGIAPLADEEMVVAIMSMLDQTYRPYVDRVLEDQRMIGHALPATPKILWKQLKEFYTAQSRVYLPAPGAFRTAFTIHQASGQSHQGRGSGGRGRGRMDRDGRGGRGGRGGQAPSRRPDQAPSRILACWDCGVEGEKRGHDGCRGRTSGASARAAIGRPVYMIRRSTDRFPLDMSNYNHDDDDLPPLVDGSDCEAEEYRSMPDLDSDSDDDGYVANGLVHEDIYADMPGLVEDDDDMYGDMPNLIDNPNNEDDDDMPGLVDDYDYDSGDSMPGLITPPGLKNRLVAAGYKQEAFAYEDDIVVLKDLHGPDPKPPTGQTVRIIIDTASGDNLIANHSLLVPGSVEEADQSILCNGIGGGSVHVTQVGILHAFFGKGIKTYFSPTMGDTNILSYSALAETHTIQCQEGAFKVTPRPDRMTPQTARSLIFTLDEATGHYVLCLGLRRVHHIKRAVINLHGIRNRDLEKAYEAQEMIKRLGWCSYNRLGELIRAGAMQGVDITYADVANAQKLLGPPIAKLLGAGTQAHSKKFKDDDDIPVEVATKDKLQCDILFIHTRPFFISVSHEMGMIMISDIPTKADAGAALVQHILQYKYKGIQIVQATHDNEGDIEKSRPKIEAEHCTLVILGHGTHAPEVEVAIREVKKGVRTTIADLPWYLPKILLFVLVCWVVRCLNMLPRASSHKMSAFTMWHGRRPNVNRDAMHKWGTIGVLQNAKTNNDMGPRGVISIWCGHTGNSGANLCFNLQTAKFMTGAIFRKTTLTHDIALRINQFSKFMDLPGPVVDEPLLEDLRAMAPLDPNQGVYPQLVPPGAEEVADDLASESDSEEVVPQEENIIPAVEVPNEEADMIEVPNEEADMIEEADVIEGADMIDVPAIPMPVPYPLRSGLRQSTRDKHIFTIQRQVYASQSIKLDDAMRKHGQIATNAVELEIRHLLDKNVFEPIDKNVRTSERPIPSSMIVVEKFTPTGDFDKLKVRLVAGGHRQDKSLYNENDISSPTVGLESVLIQIAMAADKKYKLIVVDHAAAYLNAKMDDRVPVFVTLSKKVTEVLCNMEPKYRQYVRDNGTIVVKLKKALYGCIQSAVLWYNELCKTLSEMGFAKNPYDQCVFTRSMNGEETVILLYVDDLLITSNFEHILTDIVTCLRAKYGGVTSKIGNSLDFLGMHIEVQDRQAVVTMKGYLDKLMTRHDIKTPARTPALNNLFVIDPESKLLPYERQQVFHSAVMEVHYVAKRVYPQTMTTVAFLTTRVLKPTEEDERKLYRLLSYLFRVRDEGLTLKISGDKDSGPKISAYVDMAYAPFADMKSVTGTLIMIGAAPVYWKSSKQKVVTKSTTEGELVAVSDALSQILWTKEFMNWMGYGVGPVEIFQDNKSTIALANKGRSTSERTRHINVRYFFVHQFIESGEVIITYLPTDLMVADALTKPLTGTVFEAHKATMIGAKVNV